jgi:hypothetical protein
MSDDPAALQLRLLQTVVEVAAEKNSTLVMPFPVELLRFLDKAVPTRRDDRPDLPGGPTVSSTPPPSGNPSSYALDVPAAEVQADALADVVIPPADIAPTG